MIIKDLTKEQLLEVANLLFPWMDEAIGEIKTVYWDGIVDFGHEIKDYEGERQFITFDHKQNNTIWKIRCWIYSDLNCDIDRFIAKPLKIERLPVRNQYKIQELFRKWNIKPSDIIK